MNKGYPTAPTNIAIGNVQFFKNLSIGVHFNFGVQSNGDFRRKATFKPTTATAAAVITSKLGGSAASLTTYTLLGNIGAAIAVPIFFPLVEVHPDVSFWGAFFVILSKVFPLLICPFLAA